MFGSHLEVFFKSPTFFPFILKQQLTFLDFVSYCGGILGLFLGFSMISIVEFVYYFTMRALCRKTRVIRVEPIAVDDQPSRKSYLSEAIGS
jgi:hypothetical protein